MPGAEVEGAQTGSACRAAALPQRVMHGRPWQPRCWGCGDEPGLVGMPCPTACAGTVASLAAPTLGAFTPTLAPRQVLGALLAPPQASV